MEATKERSRKRNSPEVVQLVVEVEEPLRRGIKTEASRRGISLREYVTEILEEGHAARLEEAK